MVLSQKGSVSWCPPGAVITGLSLQQESLKEEIDKMQTWSIGEAKITNVVEMEQMWLDGGGGNR